MRVLNAVRRVLLLLVMIPVIAIILDTLLRAMGAQRQNEIVSAIRDFARIFIIEPFRTVFPDQSYMQDALVALAAYGVLALLIIFIFRGLRAMASARPPRVRTAPAATTAATTRTKTTETTQAGTAKTPESTGPASVTKSQPTADDDTHTQPATADDTKSNSA